MGLAQLDGTDSRQGRKLLTLAARHHGAQCWLWLAAFFSSIALGAPVAAAGDGSTAPPVTPEQAQEAREFLGQLARQASDGGRLLMGLSIIGEGSSGSTPGISLEQMLLDTKRALANSNVPIDAVFAKPTPTGDALFDRYALAVDKRMAETNTSSLASSRLPTVLPDELLQAWEPEFGNDVRYWELRFISTALNSPQSLSGGFTSSRQFLAEAVRRGIATSNTLLLLASCGDADTWNLPPALLRSVEQLGAPASDPNIAEQQQEDQARLAVLNAAVHTDPRQAWAYYARAMFWFDQGQQQRGVADLQSGNAAPDHAYPLLWPRSEIINAPFEARPPGSAMVCGAIICTPVFPYDGLSFGGRCIDHLRETIVCTNLSGDLSALDAWQQFACSIGAKSPGSFDCRMMALMLTGILRIYVENNYAEELSATQIETLNRMRGASISVNAANNWRWEYSGAIGVLTNLDQSRGYLIASYLKTCNDLRANSNTPAVFADLSQVHYPELILPECMKKYEALSAEEQKRRVEEWRKQREAQREQ